MSRRPRETLNLAVPVGEDENGEDENGALFSEERKVKIPFANFDLASVYKFF
jgi:hypothetical protein